MLSIILLIFALLALPVLADTDNGKTPQQAPGQQQKIEHAQKVDESEAFQRQQAYFKKREEMRQRRDEALKVRERNIMTNNPGQTGL